MGRSEGLLAKGYKHVQCVHMCPQCQLIQVRQLLKWPRKGTRLPLWCSPTTKNLPWEPAENVLASSTSLPLVISFSCLASSLHIPLTHSERSSSFHTFSPIKLSALGWFPQKTRAPVRDLDAGSLFEVDPRKQKWGVWWVKRRGKNQRKVQGQCGHCQGDARLPRNVPYASHNYPSVGRETGVLLQGLLTCLPTPVPIPWWGLPRAPSVYLSSPRSKCWDKDSMQGSTGKRAGSWGWESLRRPIKVCERASYHSWEILGASVETCLRIMPAERRGHWPVFLHSSHHFLRFEACCLDCR